MSNFDITRGDRDPEEWELQAFKNTTENSVQWKVIGGLLLGGGLAVGINPITGVAVAGWAIFNAVGNIKQSHRQRQAIIDYGCVAPMLEDSDFRQYVQQTIRAGNEAQLMAELHYAIDNDLGMSDAAYNFLETASPRLLAGEKTSLTVPVAASQVVDNLPSITDSQVDEPDYTIDIINSIASPVRNCIVFGVGGSGKGMLVSNAIRRIKQNEPNRKIFYIDPKAAEGEEGYTDAICDVIRRKKCENRPPEEIIEWLNEVLDEYVKWANQQEQSLLIVDEGTVLGGACKKCKNTRIGDLILHISSLGGNTGKGRRKNVWLMAQSPYVGEMGLNLTQSSQIVSVAIITDDNTGVLKQWGKSSLIEKISQDRLQVLFENCPIPKKKRAIYWGGDSKWYAMPTLDNYSTIDRDSGKSLGDALTDEQRQSLRDVATQMQPQEQQTVLQVEELDPAELAIKHLENFKGENIDTFIKKHNGDENALIELIAIMKERDRADLLQKFGFSWVLIADPIEAIKEWSKTNDMTDEGIKQAWLLHRGENLTDKALGMVKEKLG
ncbi:MAG: hypothetical protein AAFS12_12710, partial [Cyanobacteria bacterium J06632_19]